MNSKQGKKREQILKYKLIYTILILLVYLLGKNLPLYKIDISAYLHKTVDAESLLLQTISGDINQCSLFALGILPYMIGTMIVQIALVFRSKEVRSKISHAKIQRVSLVVMLIFAIVQASIKVQDLQFQVTGDELLLAKGISVLEMVTGAMIIMWMISGNKRYGIGGQTAIVYVNIIDGILLTLKGHSVEELMIPLCIAIVVMFIVIIMENTELRIPVQRISIHNIYADKNYFAIKLNPIGIMPAMFSMAFFMLPQLLIALFIWIFPENSNLLWCQDNMSLDRPFGIAVYILILYTLTIGFSRVFVNPGDITEQFLKSGDSIQNIHAGKDTKRYLSRTINRLSLLSATVMSICLGIPMVLQLTGGVESSLVTFPSSIMMLTGMFCNLYREVMAIKDLEAYEPFI